MTLQIKPADIRKLSLSAAPAIVNGIVKHQALLKDYGITTPLRLCHLMAQLAHESAHFQVTREYASGAAYEGRKNLGNIKPGDGKRYRGRGLIQITGRANSRAAGKALGYDYEAEPELMEAFPHALLVSLWYWSSRKLNALADKDDLRGITKKINGGYNGLADRQKYLAKAKTIWGTSKAREESDPAPARVPTPRPAGKRIAQAAEIVEGVQQAMRDFGFPEVGRVDGKIGGKGSKTRGAISSYRGARSLPLSEEIDNELLADIEKAKAEGWHRPVAIERATASLSDIQDSEIQQRSGKALESAERADRHVSFGMKIVSWLGLGGLAGGAAEETLNPDETIEKLGAGQRLFAFAIDNWWLGLILLGVVGGLLYFRWGRQRLAKAVDRVEATQRADLIAYREGRAV